MVSFDELIMLFFSSRSRYHMLPVVFLMAIGCLLHFSASSEHAENDRSSGTAGSQEMYYKTIYIGIVKPTESPKVQLMKQLLLNF
jgi:hypothetical protein